MLLSLFKTKPLIDETSKMWIFDTFAWCMTTLDGDFFNEYSELILPNNTFYPGNSSSVEDMANIIFTHTLKYTGMSVWPITLVSVDNFIQKPMPQLMFNANLRGERCSIRSITKSLDATIPSIDIAFHESQLNQPQDLIAYIVQNQARILLAQVDHNSKETGAPGGKALLSQTIDLVACFMGFGVVFANTAYQFKGGCGTCNNTNLNRQAALPELETVYALALFSVIKGVDIKQVKKSLKSHLYKPFRQAHKEVIQYLHQTDIVEHKQLIALNNT